MLGMNALLLVAGYGNDELVQMVLSAGADPNETNDFGHTALHLAVVSYLKKAMVAFLLTLSLLAVVKYNVVIALLTLS